MSKYERSWKCPNCGESNTDYFNLTVNPLCWNCDKDCCWEKIIPINDLVMLGTMLDKERGVKFE